MAFLDLSLGAQLIRTSFHVLALVCAIKNFTGTSFKKNTGGTHVDNCRFHIRGGIVCCDPHFFRCSSGKAQSAARIKAFRAGTADLGAGKGEQCTFPIIL